jgi:hypothetical protein
MTAARRQRKHSGPPRRWPALAWLGLPLALAATILILTLPTEAPKAGTSEQVVTDRHTGLAINGFDPVAYFVAGKPQEGRGEHEYAYAGAVWRFRNAGNEGAFADDPDLYMPQFGGHDPVGIARGVALPGDPQLWLIVGQRLYLFYTSESRASFAEDPEGAAALATSNWPAVSHGLVP